MVFDREDAPPTKTWINALNKQEAAEQCAHLGLQSNDGLEDMRSRLKKFLYPAPTDPNTGTPPVGAPTLNPSPQTISTVPSATGQDMGEMLQKVQAITMQAVAEVTQSIAQSFQKIVQTPPQSSQNSNQIISSLFSKIRSPSSQPETIIKFLLEVDKIITLNLAPENVIISQAFALTAGSLQTVWLESISNGSDWHTLRNAVLQLFTVRQLRDIQTSLLYRQQRQAESLEAYTSEVSALFKLLAPEVPAVEVFNAIFTGLHQRCRFSLAGLHPPSTVQDLLNLARTVDRLPGSCDNPDARASPPLAPRTVNSEYYSRAPRYFQYGGHQRQNPREYRPPPPQNYNRTPPPPNYGRSPPRPVLTGLRETTMGGGHTKAHAISRA